VPSVARVEHLEGDQFIDAVFDEELANTGNLRPFRTVLLEVDCTKKKMREISSIKPADGQLRTSDTPQDWPSVTPVGGGSSLSVLLCGNPPGIRSPVRYATHAAAKVASALSVQRIAITGALMLASRLWTKVPKSLMRALMRRRWTRCGHWPSRSGRNLDRRI
jgi:hypothetical protein